MNLNDWGFLGECSGHGKLDLATYVVTIPGDLDVNPVDAFSYQMIAAHESGHWARFHGSTIGVALALMKYASERIVYDFMSDLDLAEKRALVNARRAGEPILSLLEPHSARSDDFLLSRQLWVDLSFGSRVLLDSVRTEQAKWNACRAVGSAFTDALWWGHPLFSSDAESLESPVLVELADRDHIGVVTVGGERITTRLLFECAGAIDQLLAWGIDLVKENGAPVSPLLEPFAMTALASSYGAPLRAYNRITQASTNQIRESLPTVILLCDLALNPPVPPFLHLDESAILKWEDIYPPIRFVRGCRAAAEMGPLSQLPDDDALLSYSKEVCLAAGIKNPYELDGVFFGKPLADIEKKNFTFPGKRVGELSGDYITFLSWAQRKLWGLRQKAPTLITFYGAKHVTQSRRAVRYAVGGEGAGWFEPPFHWTDKQTFGSTIGSKVATQYAASVALYLALHDAISGTKDFRTDYFPPSGMPHLFWVDIKDAIQNMFDIDIWQV
jgi:hypothetical protein